MYGNYGQEVVGQLTQEQLAQTLGKIAERNYTADTVLLALIAGGVLGVLAAKAFDRLF